MASAPEPDGHDAERPPGHPDSSDRPDPPGAPSRRALVAVVAPILALVVATQIGNYTGVWLVNENPALLIALTSQNRWLIGAVNQLDPTVYFTIGLLRSLAPDPFFYLLGYWYGDSAVRWMENRTKTVGDMLRTAERYFGTWGRPLVFLAPNNPICLLAGAARMNVVQFAVLNVAGTLTKLVLIMVLGQTFQAPIDWVLELFARYRWPLLATSLAIGALATWREMRTGASEIQQLRQLEDELEDAAPDDGPGGPAT